MKLKGPAEPQDVFAHFLRSSGRRRTPERAAILDKVLLTPGHFSAEQIMQALRAADYHVSLATVYATLALLVDCGLARRRRFATAGHAGALYERVVPGAPAMARHHLVCTLCHKVSELRDPELAQFMAERHFAGFTPAYFTLNIYGICAGCARRQRRKSLNSRQK